MKPNDNTLWNLQRFEYVLAGKEWACWLRRIREDRLIKDYLFYHNPEILSTKLNQDLDLNYVVLVTKFVAGTGSYITLQLSERRNCHA